MQLFAGSPNAVVLREPEGRVVIRNAAFTRMFATGDPAVQQFSEDMPRPCPEYRERAKCLLRGDATIHSLEVC